ncbi:hypothetical protein D0Z07_7252 [Hyphodiscus hymeniophilus]|uniref:Cbs domain-containing protein n=1 Tax=Hyphodiscus hymeniophilus TaxID=353542 RepID=A0A9P6VFQ2_9HELO|nr:hypothetical protein D0Z07_7252 [Hyphodiscus hymeniophilus]
MKWLLPRRNRVNVRPEAASQIPYTKFDESSGQIYSETTATIPTSDDRNWARDSRIVKGASYLDEEDYERYARRLGGGRGNLVRHHERLDGLKNSRIRGFRGSRSLQDAAIECILENIADITLEGIEYCSVLQKANAYLKERCSMSFYIWSIFSKVLRQNAEFMDLLRYHEEIEYPNCPLEVYTTPLTSMSYDFITSLSILTAFPLPDLVKLSAVQNLGTLEIVNTTGAGNFAVADRLLRSWHEAAVVNGAFSVLRILRLWNHEGLTEKSLAYVNDFPALAVYSVKGCEFGIGSHRIANLDGWKMTLGINVLGFLEQTCVDRAVLLRTKYNIQGTTRLKSDTKRLWDGARVRRIPRANVSMFLAENLACEGLVDSVQESASKTYASDGAKERQKTPMLKAQARQRHLLDHPDTSWDLQAYKSFARIGELRNDTDLASAGVVLGDQASVGDELANSIPVVSLRLGKPPSWLEDSLGCGLSFIRIKTRTQDLTKETVRLFDVVSKDLAGNVRPSTQPPLIKNETSRIFKNKKRKLDDVLKSFF